MKNKKKILISVFISIISFFLLSIHPSYSESFEPSSKSLNNVNAEAYIVIDTKTNTTLYSKNENKKMYPASTTKILTAILVLENSDLNDMVTANYDSIRVLPEGYSSANVEVGETLSVEQLLELLLIPSCNDVANILAKHVGGSIDSFVSMMNTKANELGLTSSHFTNPYGMHDENHYTTAHDLALLFEYCMKNDDFRRITGKASCSIPATNKSSIRRYETTNKCIIPNNEHYYKYMTCGKTGFTSSAKQCLVSSSLNNNLELICVVLGSEQRFNDTNILYNASYSNFSINKIVSKNDVLSETEIPNATSDTKNLKLLANEDILALVDSNFNKDSLHFDIVLDLNIKAPIYEGQTIGKVKFKINNIEYSSDIIASNNVKEKNNQNIMLSIISFMLISSILLEIFHIAYSNNNNSKNNNNNSKNSNTLKK